VGVGKLFPESKGGGVVVIANYFLKVKAGGVGGDGKLFAGSKGGEGRWVLANCSLKVR